MVKTSQDNTAILVFSLSPHIESKRKKLFGSHSYNLSKSFFTQLNHKLKRELKHLPYTIEWFDEKRQSGLTFGEKFENAFSYLFSKGYTQVLAVGNDSPNLNREILQYAVKHLNTNEVVFSCNQNGGVSYIGIQKSAFERMEWCDLPWQTKLLNQNLKECCIAFELDFLEMSMICDINSNKDLKSYICGICDISLSIFLLRHINLNLIKAHFGFQTNFPQWINRGQGLRAPPFAFALY